MSKSEIWLRLSENSVQVNKTSLIKHNLRYSKATIVKESSKFLVTVKDASSANLRLQRGNIFSSFVCIAIKYARYININKSASAKVVVVFKCTLSSPGKCLAHRLQILTRKTIRDTARRGSLVFPNTVITIFEKTRKANVIIATPERCTRACRRAYAACLHTCAPHRN